MKPEQKFTPKYWVFHDIDSDDIYLDTSAKSWAECKGKAKKLYPDKVKDFYYGPEESKYRISLIEIKLVEPQ